MKEKILWFAISFLLIAGISLGYDLIMQAKQIANLTNIVDVEDSMKYDSQTQHTQSTGFMNPTSSDLPSE